MKNQRFATRNMTKNKRIKRNINPHVSTIVEASVGKRLFSAILDALLFVFSLLICALFIFTPIANNALGYSSYQALGAQYQVASHLYVYNQADDDGNYSPIEVKDYTEKLVPGKSASIIPIYKLQIGEYSYFLEHVYYYYHSYLTGRDIELPKNTPDKQYDPVKDNFVAPNYKDLIGGKTPSEYYNDDWFSKNILNIDNEASYFIRDLTKERFIDQISLKDPSKSSDAVTYLKQAGYNATDGFYNSNYFTNLNNNIKGCQIFIILPSIAIAYSIFYILIPLLFKNGETLAKKFNKIAVISESGFSVKKSQVLFRELVLFVCLIFSSFIVGIGLTSIATLGVGIVILLLCTLLSKEHRSPHDYAAFTLLVDATKSVWYESKSEEEKVANNLEEKMSKYKNKNIIDKNVIQVGDTIINEEIKKEIEESKKNSQNSK